MTIEMLKTYTHLISEISLIREEIESAYTPVTSPNGHEVIGAPGSHDGDPTARATALVIQLKEWIDEEYEGGRQTVLSNKELETKIEELAPGRFHLR